MENELIMDGVIFRIAERKRSKIRIALMGVSGSGKTLSALKLAFGLGGNVAFIDTENHSADLYSHLGKYMTTQIHAPFKPQKYITAIKAAEKLGFTTIIVDSLSHAWAGEGGLLDQKSDLDSNNKSNGYFNWKPITPQHTKLIEAILHCRSHLIVGIRKKQAYIVEEQNGKQIPKKIGLAPIQREGIEYEFTTVFNIEQNHFATVSTDKTGLFNDQSFIIDETTSYQLVQWLNEAKEPDTIKEHQIHELNFQLTDCNIPYSRFYEMFGIGKLADLESSRYMEAMEQIDIQRKYLESIQKKKDMKQFVN